MQMYTIPILYCPFTPFVHPLLNEIEEHTNQWILDFRLTETYEKFVQYKKCRFASFIARSFPVGDFIDICAWADFNTLLFLVDDKFDEQDLIKDKKSFMRFEKDFMEVLEQNKRCTIEKDGSILAAASDFWNRMLLRSSASWQRKFIGCIQQMFAGLYWQFENILKGTDPNFDEYLEIRQYLGAAHLSTDSLEVTGKIFLPDEVYENPLVNKLTVICRNTVCFANDLFSLGKETEESQNAGDFNLVTLMKRKHNLTMEGAIEATAQFHDRLVRDFIDISRQVFIYDDNTNKMLKQYIQALQCQMIANIEWSTKETIRYPHIYGRQGQATNQPFVK